MAKKTDMSGFFDDDLDENRAIIPIGLKLVDPALGGGLPQGVLGELFGPTGSGKTSVGYLHIAAQQKLGNISILFDLERSWNPSMGARYGVDTKHVNKKKQPTFMKSSKPEMKIIEVLFSRIKTILYEIPEVTFILVDSLAALSPQKATEKKEGDQTNTDALDRARLLSFYMRELDRWISDTGETCTVAFVNHEKEVLAMGPSYGAPKKSTGGGSALKFYSSFRLQFNQVKTDKIKVHDPVTGQDINKEDKLYIRVQAVKNRFHPPFIPATFVFDIGGGTGIDRISTALAHAYAQKAIVKKPKGHYVIPAEWSISGKSEEIFGAPKMRAYYEEQPELFDRLEDHLAANLSGSDAQILGDVEDDDDNMLDLQS